MIDRPAASRRVPADLIRGLDSLVIRTPEALLMRLALFPLVYTSGSQTIDGAASPTVGWLLTGVGAPVPMTEIGYMCKLSGDRAASAMGELIELGFAVRSDQGAFGLVGWAETQQDRVSPATARKRRSRDKACDSVTGHVTTRVTDHVTTDVTRVSSPTPPLSLSLDLDQDLHPSLPVVKQEIDPITEIMELWHSLRIDLGILKRAGVRARCANEAERKGLAKVDREDVKTALRRMAERLRRDAEIAGLARFDEAGKLVEGAMDGEGGAKWFTVEHLLRERNRQRYLDAPDLDTRKPQAPRGSRGRMGHDGTVGHYKPAWGAQ